MASIAGGCFCGAIRYEADVAPLGSMVCHCRSCRRLAGAPVVAWLTFARDRLRFTRGAPMQFHSSAHVTRTFCPGCGTPLTYANASTGEEIDVSTCTLDEPEAFPPTYHSWLSHDLSWVRCGDGLPTFQQSKPGGG
jgi:hypothetical protein